MDKIVDMLPTFMQEWSLIQTIIYTVVPLVVLLLINTAVQNKITDHDSRNGMKMGLGALTGLWLLFTVFIIVIKVIPMI